jgi:hypothetical protein
MNSKNLPLAAVPNNPGSKAIKTNDPRSISKLLELLEERLDEHIDDNRYVQSWR